MRVQEQAEYRSQSWVSNEEREAQYCRYSIAGVANDPHFRSPDSLSTIDIYRARRDFGSSGGRRAQIRWNHRVSRYTKNLMIRFIAKICACVVSLMAICPASADTRFLQGLSDPDYFEIASEIVGRPYHIYVALPAGYDASDDRRYPTIYLLDGGELFPMITPYQRYLGFGEGLPDAIVVGISYGSDDFREGNFRSTDYTAPSDERDYWGGASGFQTFLRSELIPEIEHRYRADPARRIVFGHSLGGQFVLYTAQTQSDLFWGHIASNPALHRNLPFFLEQQPAATGTVSRLFVASGSLDDPRFRDPALVWIEHWTAEETLPWLLEATTIDGHTHMSLPPEAYRQGLRWLFEIE